MLKKQFELWQLSIIKTSNFLITFSKGIHVSHKIHSLSKYPVSWHLRSYHLDNYNLWMISSRAFSFILFLNKGQFKNIFLLPKPRNFPFWELFMVRKWWLFNQLVIIICESLIHIPEHQQWLIQYECFPSSVAYA